MSEKESHLDRTIRWMNHNVRVCMSHDAFVGAMTLMMAHTAALAGYYAGRDHDKQGGDHDEFMSFYNAYYNPQIFPDIRPPLSGNQKKRRSMIYTHFRNGLIHEHLMKKGTAIDQGLTKPPFYHEITNDLIVINVDFFFPEYLRVLGEYSNDVKYSRKKDIKDNFIKRAKYLGASDPIV